MNQTDEKTHLKRIKSLISNIYYFPIFVFFIEFLALFFSDIVNMLLPAVNIPSPFDLKTKFEILLTSAIAMFACVEGYSTRRQVELQDRREKMEYARFEIEVAYGPLYNLFTETYLERGGRRMEKNATEYLITEGEKDFLDGIMTTYPFMFPEIYNAWREEIRNMEAKGWMPREYRESRGEAIYHIPLNFREKIIQEYSRRVERYNKLLKKID